MTNISLKHGWRNVQRVVPRFIEIRLRRADVVGKSCTLFSVLSTPNRKRRFAKIREATRCLWYVVRGPRRNLQ